MLRENWFRESRQRLVNFFFGWFMASLEEAARLADAEFAKRLDAVRADPGAGPSPHLPLGAGQPTAPQAVTAQPTPGVAALPPLPPLDAAAPAPTATGNGQPRRRPGRPNKERPTA